MLLRLSFSRPVLVVLLSHSDQECREKDEQSDVDAYHDFHHAKTVKTAIARVIRLDITYVPVKKRPWVLRQGRRTAARGKKRPSGLKVHAPSIGALIRKSKTYTSSSYADKC